MSRLLGLLESPEQPEGSPTYTRLLLGMLYRGGCQLARAAEQFEQVLDDEAFDGEARVVACTMLVDTLAQQGELEAARTVVERASADDPLPRGVLDLAEGDLEAAVIRLQMAVDPTPTDQAAAGPCRRLWALLFQCSALLERDEPAEAGTALERASRFLARHGRFEEPHAFATTSWLRLELLRAQRADAPGSEADLRRATRSATVYARSYPRYHRLCEAFLALAQSRQGHPTSPAKAEQVVKDLEAMGCTLDAGKVAAQWVRSSEASSHRFVSVLRPRARELLHLVGATRWLESIESRAQSLPADPPTLVLPAGGGEGGSLPKGPPTVILGRGDGTHRDVELNTLFEVNRAISAKLDIDDLLMELLEQVDAVLAAERGAVFWYEQQQFRCVASLGWGDSESAETSVSRTVLHDVIARRKAVLTDDALDDKRFRNADSIVAPRVRSILCAPLLTPKRVYGVLYLDTTVRTGAFTDQYRLLLEVFASQAAVAMENAVAFREIAELNAELESRVEQRTADLRQANERLQATLTTLEQTELKLLSARKEALEAEMRTAAALQRAIIPAREIIHQAGATFVGITEPASMVGGDFWTHRRFGPDRVLLLIADVSGHGVGPGMLTSFLQGCLTTLSRLGHVLGPSALLGLLSRSVHEAADEQLWMTALACLYDRSTRTLAAASGGHVRGFLLPAGSDDPLPVGEPGTVLGLDQKTSLQTVTFEVAPGDRLLLYTDGAVECHNDKGRPYGARRLVKSLVERRREALDTAAAGIVADCKAFCGDVPLEDDLSVVLIEFD